MAPQERKAAIGEAHQALSLKGLQFIPHGNQKLDICAGENWHMSWFCGWRRYRYHVGGLVWGCLAASDGGGGGGW